MSIYYKNALTLNSTDQNVIILNAKHIINSYVDCKIKRILLDIKNKVFYMQLNITPDLNVCKYIVPENSFSIDDILRSDLTPFQAIISKKTIFPKNNEEEPFMFLINNIENINEKFKSNIKYLSCLNTQMNYILIQNKYDSKVPLEDQAENIKDTFTTTLIFESREHIIPILGICNQYKTNIDNEWKLMN